VRIEVAEWARSGAFTFIRWVMPATGEHGPFAFSGIDRVRTGPLVAVAVAQSPGNARRLSSFDNVIGGALQCLGLTVVTNPRTA
jgi:hypothetical protein